MAHIFCSGDETLKIKLQNMNLSKDLLQKWGGSAPQVQAGILIMQLYVVLVHLCVCLHWCTCLASNIIYILVSRCHIQFSTDEYKAMRDAHGTYILLR